MAKRVSKRAQFATGYKNADMVKTALRNGKGGRSKAKRDKMDWGITYSDGTNADGTPNIVQHGRSDKSVGTFNGVLSSKDSAKHLTYQYGKVTNQLGADRAETGRSQPKPFTNHTGSKARVLDGFTGVYR